MYSLGIYKYMHVHTEYSIYKYMHVHTGWGDRAAGFSLWRAAGQGWLAGWACQRCRGSGKASETQAAPTKCLALDSSLWALHLCSQGRVTSVVIPDLFVYVQWWNVHMMVWNVYIHGIYLLRVTGRQIGLFGDHIVPAVLYSYTQMLQHDNLVNSKGTWKPLVTTARECRKGWLTALQL